ncbi:hypothetical protein GP486_001573 [Trichoglossum hirsutum]|uniref:DUF7708 domain-containing protein n=1 Tax=Trichoglossum hirsutum TaxID=265104 RepID=A0A9P8LGL3_9PEZI|nr:hypothetical protein GP486_001573 [Trichoglossum hirsutum]
MSSNEYEFDQELRNFIPEQDAREREKETAALWEATHSQKENLFKAMEDYQEKLAKKYPSMETVNLRACDWPQVMKELERAVECHRTGGSGFFESVYKRFRALKSKASTIKQWLEVLPSGSYGSSLCGAFKVILSAASRVNEIDVCIHAAVSDIPDAICFAGRYMHIYKRGELTPMLIGLYSAVLVAFKDIIDYLLESWAKKAVSAFRKGESYKANLKQSIEKVKECANSLEKEAQMRDRACLYEMMGNINSFREDVRREVYQAFMEFFSANPLLDPRTGVPYEVEEDTPNNRSRAKKHARVEALSETAIAENPENQSQSRPSGAESTAPREAIASTRVILTLVEGIVVEELIAVLMYNADIPARDLEECRDFSGMMSRKEINRAFQAMRSVELQEWLTDSTKSRVLLINGNGPDPTVLISPLSVLLAMLSHAYENSRRAVVLSHFCSLHADTWDPKANATGMIISLIGQLLSYQGLEFNLSSFDDDFCQSIEDDDLEMLCIMFLRLVKQLPRTKIVFCLIDTISVYETKDRLVKTARVLSTLTHLVANRRKGPIFKLLVTDPRMSDCAHDYIKEKDTLELDDFFVGDGTVYLEDELDFIGVDSL